jgi:hypothetical protein
VGSQRQGILNADGAGTHDADGASQVSPGWAYPISSIAARKPTPGSPRFFLTVNAVYAEPHAPADAWPAIRSAIDELATWIGAEEVRLPALPPAWA